MICCLVHKLFHSIYTFFHVGRSLEYWKNNYPTLQSLFPEKLKDIDYNKFYKATNNVKPSLIRTNADELTYHLHVLIRYEIEKGLIEGSYNVEDLPSIWNKKYFDYLTLSKF